MYEDGLIPVTMHMHNANKNEIKILGCITLDSLADPNPSRLLKLSKLFM